MPDINVNTQSRTYSYKSEITPTRAMLAVWFPQAFTPHGLRMEKQPLKIGIHNDIIALCPWINPTLLRLAIKKYCMSPRYMSQVVEGAARINLDGDQEGIVTADEEAYAKNGLMIHADRVAKWKEAKRKLDRERTELYKKRQRQASYEQNRLANLAKKEAPSE